MYEKGLARCIKGLHENKWIALEKKMFRKCMSIERLFLFFWLTPQGGGDGVEGQRKKGGFVKNCLNGTAEKDEKRE